MGSFEIRQNRFNKITGIAPRDIADLETRRLRAIVKVNVDGYVPVHVDLRHRIDGEMFTAEFDAEVLGQLEEDDGVDSVAISERLDIIE